MVLTTTFFLCLLCNIFITPTLTAHIEREQYDDELKVLKCPSKNVLHQYRKCMKEDMTDCNCKHNVDLTNIKADQKNKDQMLSKDFYQPDKNELKELDQQAFTAELSTERSLGNEGPITFDKIILDSGDNFVPLLGTFQCPDDDIYVFYWTISAPYGRVATSLVKQGKTVKYGPLTSEIPGNFSGTSSMSSILQCTENEMVWLKAETWPDEDSCNKIAPIYSSFSAVKVFSSSYNDSIAFTAELSTNTTTDSDSNLIYDNVLANYGNAYDSEKGEFVCPWDGVFVFSVSAHGTLPSYINVYLRKNGSYSCNLGRPLNTGSSDSDTGTSTGTCIIECEGEEMVYVSTTPKEHYAQTSTFTGYQLM